MDFAETNWPTVITQTGAVILAGQIREVEGPQPTGVNQQTGTDAVRVLRELTPGRWKGPPEIAVKFTQLASSRSRLREGNGGWNGVDVRPGAMLLMGMAAQSGGPAGPAPLEAVSQIASLEDPLVAGVTEALRIEGTDSKEQRIALFQEALNSQLPVLAGYAHFALGRKQRLPREDAASLEIAALLDSARPEDERAAAESTLELELWAHHAPDDAVNGKILAALLRVLSRQEAGLERSTVVALQRVLISDAPADPEAAQTYRSILLRSVPQPDVKAVRAALSHAEKDGSVSAQAKQLLELFSREPF